MFILKSRSRLFFSFFLLLLVVAPAFASPFRLEQDAKSLRFLLDKKVVVEVLPIAEAKVKELKQWLDNPNFSELKALGGKISCGPVTLLVDDALAKRWSSTSEALAIKFVDLITKELVPILSWGRTDLLIPLGESRELAINLPRGITIEVEASAPELIDLRAVDDGRYVIKGIARGSLVLRAVASNGQALPELPVLIKPWAASWGDGPGRFDYKGPVDAKRLRTSLERWLSARALAGSAVSAELKAESAEGLWSVLTKASAAGAISVEKSFKVLTSSSPVTELLPAEVVMLSNHPEKIFAEGVLYRRRAAARSYRFMWHHRNDPEGEERFLWLKLGNPNPVARRLSLIWSSYGPSPDEIHVGHTAALNYAMQGAADLSELVTLPANGVVLMEIRRVKPGQTVSGMAYLSDVDGASLPLEVTVSASAAQSTPPSLEVESKDPGRTASGVFPAQLITAATHVLGGPYTYIEYGNEPYVQDIENSHPSYGNFGTIYRTRLVLFNPAQGVRQADIGFASAGGAARGVLSIDGTIYDLPMGRSGEGVPVASVSLQPGERRQVELELFPQAGSNYPIRIVVKSSFERREREALAPERPPTIAIP